MASASKPERGATGGPNWLAEAVRAANVPTLACILVQLTGDRHWIEGRFVPSRTRGLEDNDDGGLPVEVRDEIKAAALTALQAWLDGRAPAIPNPSDDLLLEMMGVSLGEKIPADYVTMIRHELRLPPAQPQAARGAAADDSELHNVPAPPGFDVLIIGAGISGLCAAIELSSAGIPYTIVERRPDLGGVWLENRYPGAAVDVPSHLYSFSFAPFRWSRFFAESREIHRYLQDVADRFDVRSHIRFGLEVTQARFDEASGRWEADVVDAAGRRQTLRASAVISGVGAFNKPRLPDLPGMADFKGPSVHTARYPEAGLDLKGKKVVVVGNGASAMQVVPAIVDDVASLAVVQRTPQWVAPFPKFKEAIAPALQRLLDEVPLYRLWYRLRLSWAFNDKLYDSLQKDPSWDGKGRSINAANDAHRRGLTAYMKAELGQAERLMPELLPDYPPFGKRMLLDNGWFRALARDHVRLITGGVVKVLPDGVLTDTGEKLDADVLIWATGFDVIHLLTPLKVRGVGGRDIHDDWEGDDARAYLGTVVPGYPNLFCLYGPNTQFGHGGSLITILERQMHYVMSMLRKMFAQGIATVDVRREVYDAYNREVDRKHAGMVWTYPGVTGYYRNSKGRIIVNNPFRIIEFWRMTEEADLSEYLCSPPAAQDARPSPAGATAR
jgi:4-hydroxyacetophenone monooxygenase